jgi:hypothetical protein
MTLLLAVATAIGAAAVGGVYLAFTVMVLPALARLPAADATAAMREINRRAERGAFIGVFIGAALVAVALGVAALFERQGWFKRVWISRAAGDRRGALVREHGGDRCGQCSAQQPAGKGRRSGLEAVPVALGHAQYRAGAARACGRRCDRRCGWLLSATGKI